jgi:sec-independent protein translocase protein TatA
VAHGYGIKILGVRNMLRGGLEPWHVIIILALLVILFGSRKLPDAARSVGQSLRIFKSEMKAAANDTTPASPAPQAAPVAPPQAVENVAVVPPVAQVTADAIPQPVSEQR